MSLDTIIYCRVSTDEQADNGYGRDHQYDVLKRYCKIKEYGIAKEYLEDYSAKDFNRPEWIRLEQYVKANKKTIKRVLFTKWDRFSRNMEEAMRVIKQFRKWGIELNAVDQQMDISDPNHKILLSFYLVLPEVENDNISSRTKDGMYRAAKNGAFTGTPPFGYSRTRFDKNASLEPNKDADLVIRIFKKVSLGVESLEGLRKQYKKEGYTKCKQTFYNMLRNKVYIGQVKVPEYKKDDAYWINGLHDAIIEDSIFHEVQNVLNGKSRNVKTPSSRNESLPLRGFLVCENCGGNLTGSVSKGNGGSYGYYHCRGKCKNRISAISSEQMLYDEVLDKIIVNDNVLELYKAIIIDIQKNKKGNQKNKAKEIQMKIDEAIKSIENTEDKYTNDLLTHEVFNRMIVRYKRGLMSLRAELIETNESNTLPVKTIDKALGMLKNIPQLYKNGNYDQKISFLGLLFPEKLVISKNGCRTNKSNIVIELLCRINKASQELGTKKAIKNDSLSNFAPPLGLEPRTKKLSKLDAFSYFIFL